MSRTCLIFLLFKYLFTVFTVAAEVNEDIGYHTLRAATPRYLKERAATVSLAKHAELVYVDGKFISVESCTREVN
jgi:hypothetical protein